MFTATNPLTPTFDAQFASGLYRVQLSTGEVLSGADLAPLSREVAMRTYGVKRWAHATPVQRARWAGHEAGVIAACCGSTR
ncbi:hypothetical protein ACTHRK_17220 [Dietzia cercidiphylli]|uniref:hypothetical protein n=1 Tax=Dietzia cercidiphylli TaxID=498199 RepID=UPI003F80458B